MKPRVVYRAPTSYGYVAPRTTVVVVNRPRAVVSYTQPVTEKCTPAVYNPTYNSYTPGGSYNYQYKRYVANYCSPKSKGRSSYYKPVVYRKRITRLPNGRLCSGNNQCASGCCATGRGYRKVRKSKYNTKYRQKKIYYTNVRNYNTACARNCVIV